MGKLSPTWGRLWKFVWSFLVVTMRGMNSGLQGDARDSAMHWTVTKKTKSPLSCKTLCYFNKRPWKWTILFACKHTASRTVLMYIEYTSLYFNVNECTGEQERCSRDLLRKLLLGIKNGVCNGNGQEELRALQVDRGRVPWGNDAGAGKVSCRVGIHEVRGKAEWVRQRQQHV